MLTFLFILWQMYGKFPFPHFKNLFTHFSYSKVKGFFVVVQIPDVARREEKVMAS